MSGCCGPGPVIVNSPAAARVDVETLLLCDVLPDGTVAGLALVEPVYDTVSGDRVGTRTVDPVTGAAYTPTGVLQACQPDGCNATTTTQVLCDTAGDGTATPFVRATTFDCEGVLLATLDRTLDGVAYTVTGTVGVCPTSPDCESPTTPTATVGLCLADGTPIAVTVVRDCEGVVTSEGWINLVTGAFSAGAPPAGALACGSSQSIQLSGTFCDIDGNGDVVGLVLIEYSYDADGAIESVRLVDAVTGATYTPTGTITVCPAGVEQPERDLLQLCDTAGDGAVTPFVRDYARDENGAIVGFSDYLLDGGPYTPAGTVRACTGGCRDTSTTLLCDVTSTETQTVFDPANVSGPDGWQIVSFAGANPGFGPTGPMPYDVYQGVASNGLVSYGARPDFTIGPGPGWTGWDTVPVRWVMQKVFTAPQDGVATLTATGFMADGAGRVRVNGVDMGLYSQWGQPGVGGGGQAPVTAGPNLLEIEVRDDWGFNWVTGRLDLVMTRTVQFFRKQVTDCDTGDVISQTDFTLDGQPYTVTGEVGQCAPVPDSSCCETVPQVDTEVLQLCDVAPDGTVTAFLRQLAYLDGSSVPVVTDTVLDGVTPYTPTGEVGSCGGSAEECRDSSTVLVCDVPADSTTIITPAIVDGVVADVGQGQFQDRPGPYTDLWAGNTFLYPAGAGPAQEHLAATGQLTADMAGCDGASGTVTISVRVRNDGPDAGQAWDGALRLFRGMTAIATHNALEWEPVGWQGTLTVSAPVTAADIAAGDIRVALMLETYHLGAKSWTVDQFSAAIELEGCEATSSTQFLRTLITDCESGEVVSTVDTTLDGAPYTVTGDVAQCTPAGSGSDPVQPEQDIVELCDVQADGTVVPLIRDYQRDAGGSVVGYSDYDLAGMPYTATGTVGRCCTDVVDTRCVRLVTDDVEIITGADWVVYSDPTTPTATPVDNPGGTSIAALPPGTDTIGAEHYVGVLYAPSNVGGGTAYIHVSQLAAPGAEVLGLYFAGEYVGRETGWWRLPYEGQQHIVIHYRVAAAVPNGPVVAATLSLADSLNNGSGGDREYTRTTYCDGRVEYRDSGSNVVPNPVTSLVAPCFDRYQPVGGQCETTSVQTIRLCDLDPTVEPDEEGRRCAVPFLRHIAFNCAGAIVGFRDTGLDGTTPYTPVQVVDCQCATGEGVTSSIEVPWTLVSVAEDPDGTPQQDFIYTVAPENDPTRIGTIRVHVSRAAGGACGAYDINNLVFSNTAAYTLTLDAVAQEMSYLRVDLRDFDTFEPVGISSGSSEPTRLGGTAGWNAAHTRIVPAESNGTGYMYWDNPPETVAWTVFNTGGGTSCGSLSFQGMSVEPGGCCGGNEPSGCSECDTVALCDVPAGGDPVPFLRHVCRDCEGTVTSVTDTTLDATTPYTPTGVVADCGAVKDCPTIYGTECWELVEAQAAYDNTNTAGAPCGTITPGMTQCAGTFQINSWIVDGVERVVGPPPQFVSTGCGGNPNQLHGAWAASLDALDPGTDWQPAYNGVCLWYVRTNAVNPDTVYGTMVLERIAGGTPAVYTLGSAQSSSRTLYTRTFVQECDGTTTVQWLDAEGNEIDEPDVELTPCEGGAVLAAAPGDGTSVCTPQIIERCGCDDVNGDGSLITRYVELWAVDPCGVETPELIGSYVDGDFEQPYTPVSPVDCAGGGGGAGSSPVSTAIRRLTGAGVFDVTSLGVLQSVTVTVLAGAAQVTTSDGVADVPAGATLTWSVVTGGDSSVGVLTVATDAADDVLVHATYR